MRKKIPYPYLSDAFSGWYQESFQKFGEYLIETESSEYLAYILNKNTEFFRTLGHTEESFKNSFISPYFTLEERGQLTLEVLNKISDIQSKVIGHRDSVLEGKDTPLVFKVEISSIEYLEALDWTVLQIYDLKLWESERDTEILYKIPSSQCWYCGKIEADPRGRRFNKKLRYCHSKNCSNSSAPNPSDHIGCCYGEWLQIKKTLQQRLDRNQRNVHKIHGLFREFCNERLAINLKKTVKLIGEYEDD